MPCPIHFHGNIFKIVSNNPAIIGIDIETIIILPPISILLAIAFSPESLQILTANSVKIAIPVIFISIVINSLCIETLLAKLLSISTIPDIFVKVKASIKQPAIIDAYIANSGLCCFKIIIITKEINPIPNYFDNFHIFSPMPTGTEDFGKVAKILRPHWQPLAITIQKLF